MDEVTMSEMSRGSVLSFAEKLTYSTAELCTSLAPMIVSGWLLYFYTSGEVDGVKWVSYGAFGLILMMGRLVDSVADPLIGYWSDTTKSRWGRRLPFMFWGAPLLALAFVLLWFPPFEPQSFGNNVYLAAVLGLLWFAYTVVVAPYLSLLPEITPYDSERLSVSAFMGIFDIIAVLLATLVFGILLDVIPDGLTIGPLVFTDRFKVLAIPIGIIVLLSAWTPLINIREKPYAENKNIDMGFVESYVETMKNPSFPVYLVAVSALRISIDVVVAAIPFLAKFVLGKDEATAGILQGIVVLLAAVLFPLVTYLSNRYGKKKIFLLSMIWFGLDMLLFGLIGYFSIGDPFWQAVVVLVLAAFPVSVQFVLPRPILADIIDVDEERTGFRREATYNGMEGLITKFAAGIAGLITTQLFLNFGAETGNSLGILLCGPASAVILIIGFFGFRPYPIDK
jgi:glycoside/pentoside/hexuronide:cation symporter, GPH family